MKQPLHQKATSWFQSLQTSQKIALALVALILIVVIIFGAMDIFSTNNKPSGIPLQKARTATINTDKKFNGSIGQKNLFGKKSAINQEQIAEQQKEANEALDQGKSYLSSTFSSMKKIEQAKPKPKKENTFKPKNTGYYDTNNTDENQQNEENSEFDQSLETYQTNASNGIVRNMKQAFGQILKQKDDASFTITESKALKNESAESNKLISKYDDNKIKPNDLNINGSIKYNVLPGQTIFGVMVSKIDSDNPGPVIVQSVGSKLHDAKFIGSFTRQNDKVSIPFNEMVYDGHIYKIDAVAVNSKTYATALADSVDHHYFERYGLFAIGTFLGGVSNAILNEGQTINTTNTATQTTRPELSLGEEAMVGLGNTGNQIAPVLEKDINRPPTVTVYRGSGVGILFLKPLKLIKSKYQNQTPEWEKELNQ